MPPRVASLFHLLLLATMGTALVATPAEATLPPLRTVQVREVPGGVRLLFEPLGRTPALERLTVEQAREVLAAFHEDFGPERTPAAGSERAMVLAALACGSVTCGRGEDWEKRLRAEYVARYGEPEVALPPALASDRLAAVLRLSPRYMKEGVREAAVELFADPLFLAGVSTSVVAYFLAWAVPEPLFSKTVAVVVTVGLVAAFGVAELHQNDVSGANGGPWTPTFKRIFDKAGMSLEAKENLVYLQGHKGPHPEAYHEEVFERLRIATEDCRTQAECRGKLVEALDKIAGEVCTPGSSLHQMLTKKP